MVEILDALADSIAELGTRGLLFPLECHHLMSQVRQTRHLCLGTCYCLKPWLDMVSAMQFNYFHCWKADVHELFLRVAISIVRQDLSRKINASEHHPSTREAKAHRHVLWCSGENFGVWRPRCALGLCCLQQDRCGAASWASGTLTSSVSSHRAVKLKHRTSIC